MATPPRPRGARPMPISNGSMLGAAPPTSSGFNPSAEILDSPDSIVSPYGSIKPRLNLNLGTPQPRAPSLGSTGSDTGMSLRPKLSLVYGQNQSSSAAAPVPKKPSLKLGLKIGPSVPALNLAIPAAGPGGASPIESYYGVIPTQPTYPNTSSNSLSTPMTEPFSAETLRPPIATIIPGHSATKDNSMDDLHRAIEAIQIKDAAEQESEETVQWNNDMFESIRRLGEGAGGAVYQVKQRHTGKMMAMKTIPANPETPPLQLRRELEFLSTCVHPNITEFYGAYLSSAASSSADVVLLMEFCEGGSLETVSKKLRGQNRRVGETIVAKLAEGILRGLDFLHGRKIIHRDIKPSNILLTREGVVKLCDFGVSGVLINSMAGTFTGTSWYMSPERIRGDPYTIRSDVWSTGLTLLELARGKFPYPPDLGPIELLSVIVNGEIPELEDEPATETQPGATWSEGMKLFIKRCLIISGTERPAPREILLDPWIKQNQQVELEMDVWMRRVYGWPKPSSKKGGSRRTKNSGESGGVSGSGSTDQISSSAGGAVPPIDTDFDRPTDITVKPGTATPRPSTPDSMYDSPLSVRPRYRKAIFLSDAGSPPVPAI